MRSFGGNCFFTLNLQTIWFDFILKYCKQVTCGGKKVIFYKTFTCRLSVFDGITFDRWVLVGTFCLISHFYLRQLIYKPRVTIWSSITGDRGLLFRKTKTLTGFTIVFILHDVFLRMILCVITADEWILAGICLLHVSIGLAGKASITFFALFSCGQVTFSRKN